MTVVSAESMGGTVPLSEHEQRQLEQIEQALYADHPRLAKAMRAKDPKVHYRRRVIQAAIGFLIGVGLVAASVVVKHNLWLVVAGLVVMVVSCIWAVASYRRMTGMLTRNKRGRSKAKPKMPMMERLEERWRHRQERDGR